MKNHKYFLMALFLAFAFLGCSYYEKSKDALSPQEAKVMMENNPHIFIVDVRPQEMYEKQHFETARNIPLKELQARLDEIPTGRPVLLHCQKGNSVKQAYPIVKKYRPDLKEVYYIDGTPLFK